MRILFVLKLVPDLLAHMLVEQRALLARFELGHRVQVSSTLKVSAGNSLFISNLLLSLLFIILLSFLIKIKFSWLHISV